MNKGQSSAVRKQLRGSVSLVAVGVMLLAMAVDGADAAVSKPGAPSAMSADVADLVGKAQLAMRQGHPEIAVIYLKNAEAVAPDAADVHLDLGEALLAVGNASGAEPELNTARQKGVAAAKVLPLIFQSMLAQREGQLLLNRYPEPPQSDRSELAMNTLRARAYAQVQIGKMADATATMERSLAIGRTTPNLAARAQLAQDTGDTALAMKLIDEALKKDPSNVGALTMKIGLLQRFAQADKALPFADALMKASHNSPIATVTRAGIYLQMNQDAKAEADIDATLTAAPNLSQAIFYKALLRARAHDVKGAWVLAQTLPREFTTTKPDIGMAVAQMAIAAGQRETGTDILHTVVQTFPTNTDARIRLAQSYMVLNETDYAIQALAPLQDSADPRISALMAQIYAKQKDYGQYLKYLGKASQGGFGGDTLKLQLATLDLQRGNFDEAEHILEQLNAKQANRPEVVGPLIDVLLKKGNVGDATKIANTFSQAVPTNPFGPLYQGGVLAQKGDVDGAITAYSAALARNPKFAPALFNRGIQLASRGDLQAALTDLQSAVAADPKNDIFASKLAQVLYQAGQDDKATAILKKAAQTNPKDFSICADLAQYYVAHKRFGDALAVVTTFLHTSPDNQSALSLEGAIQLANGAVDESIKTFGRLQKANPGSTGAKIMLAQAYMKKGNNGAARGLLVQAMAAAPKAPEPRVALIQLDFAAKNQTAALADAQDFAAKAPSPGSAQVLAAVLMQANKAPEAEQVLKQSLSAYPNGLTATRLSGLLRQRGQAKAADDVLANWVSKHPDDLDVRLAYGTSLMSHDAALAQAQFRAVLAKQPYNLSALNNLAWILREKDPKGALVYATRAQKLSPNFPSVIDTVGWISWQMKDHVQALNLLTRAHAGAPADPEIAYHLAVVLNGSGRAQDAKKILVGALANGNAFDDREKAKILSDQIK